MSRISIPKILVPLAITDEMLISSTVTEPNTGETEWVSGGTYVAGDICIRLSNHRKYMAQLDHTGITIAPEDDPTRWNDIGTTDRYAMFDGMRTTRTVATETLTVVLQPGFFNALNMYMLSGAMVEICVKDAPGGTVIRSETWPLDGPYADEYDWCFGPFRENTKIVSSGIMPYPEAELTITISAGAGTEVGIGMLAVGDRRPLILGEWGGTEYGASAEPFSSSTIKTDVRRNTTIRKGPSATNMRFTVTLPSADADYALACIQEVMDTPAAIVATEAPGYAGLNVFGLISGPVTWEGPRHATLEATVKGIF